MEQILTKQIREFLEMNEPLVDCQYGFSQGWSRCDAIIVA